MSTSHVLAVTGSVLAGTRSFAYLEVFVTKVSN
jgi:hypothetical protein